MAQTYLAKEIIVIDDGSTDNTKQIQQDFPQIKYFYQNNSGVSSARNLGIKNSTYEWIAFLDSDDEWHKDKLQEQVAFHKNNSSILMSYTDERWIRDDVEVKIPKKFRKFGGEIFQECLSHCIIAPSAILIHKNLLEEAGVFDESLEVCEDYDLWLRIAIEHKIGLVDKKLITKYAGHENQLSFKYWGMDRFRVLALEKLLGDLREIPSQAEDDRILPSSSLSTTMRNPVPETLPSPSLSTTMRNPVPKTLPSPSLSTTMRNPVPKTLPSPSLSTTMRNLVLETLVQKYTLLLKGAIKYDKITEINYYKEKINFHSKKADI